MHDVTLGIYNFEEYDILSVIKMRSECILVAIEDGRILKLYNNNSGIEVALGERSRDFFKYIALKGKVFIMRKSVNFYC